MEEEKEKKEENDTAFRAWLQKKRGQVLERRRVHRAKQSEDMSTRVRDASLRNKFIKRCRLNLFTEGDLNSRPRTYGRNRKSGPRTSLTTGAACI